MFTLAPASFHIVWVQDQFEPSELASIFFFFFLGPIPNYPGLFPTPSNVIQFFFVTGLSVRGGRFLASTVIVPLFRMGY